MTRMALRLLLCLLCVSALAGSKVPISDDVPGGVVLTPGLSTETPAAPAATPSVVPAPGKPALSATPAEALAAGTPVLLVTVGPTQAPTAPPAIETGRTILYVANIDGPWSVYQMRPDGTGQKRVTKQDLSVNRWSYFSPALSPDLTRLLFVMQRGVNSYLFLKDLAKNSGKRITRVKDYEFDPTWSADGKQMAWSALVQPNGYQIFTAPARGWPPRQITAGEWPCTHPEFSPDGREICFVSKRDGVESLYVLPLAGGDIRRLTGPGLPAFYPAWAPDGKNVLFVSVRDKKTQIFRVDAVQGSTLVQISDGSSNDKDPAWSPDGLRIVFVSDQEGNDEIWTMSPDGKDRRRVTFNHAQSRHPCWR